MALSKLKKFATAYKEEIICNPTFATEVECGLKCVSYLISGRFNNSTLVSEFIFGSTQLLSLCHDFVLKNALQIQHAVDTAVLKLQSFLNIIEYLQIFFEYGGLTLAKERGKWIVVTVIQLIKAIIKLLLLLKYKQGIQKRFPVFSLDRKKIQIDFLNNGKFGPNTGQNQKPHQGTNIKEQLDNYHNSINFAKCNVLKSGKIIRKLECSPERSKRTWQLPKKTSLYKHLVETRLNVPPTRLNDLQTFSEIVYIVKPLAHLGAMRLFGQLSWYPLMISLSMDLFNIAVLKSTENRLNRTEVNELYIRKTHLLLYLLKSPMFDNHTKAKLISILRVASNNIPVFGRLLVPFIDYLPTYQKVYFHVH